MMDDAAILRLRIELESMLTEREAMLAENKKRELNREALAYGEAAFQDKAGEIYSLLKYTY